MKMFYSLSVRFDFLCYVYDVKLLLLVSIEMLTSFITQKSRAVIEKTAYVSACH